jgi:hypothetical protein
MPICFSTIKSDLVGKGFHEVQSLVKKLEASERVMLQHIFQDKTQYLDLDKNQKTLLSLHEKLVEIEEPGCFTWLVNLFRGPWFKTIRVALGEFMCSSDLASLVVAKLSPAPKLDPNNPIDHKAKRPPSPPIAISMGQLKKPQAPLQTAGDKLGVVAKQFIEFEDKLDLLVEKIEKLERAIERNATNLTQQEPNRALQDVNEQMKRLGFAIQDIKANLDGIRKLPFLDEEDSEKLNAFSSKLAHATQAMETLDILLPTLKTKIRDREAYTGSVAQYEKGGEENRPFWITSVESYAEFISGVRQSLQQNAIDVPALLHQIKSVAAAFFGQDATNETDLLFDMDP